MEKGFFWFPLPLLMNIERNIFSSNLITLLALGLKINLSCQKMTFISTCLLSYCVLKFSAHKNQTSSPLLCGYWMKTWTFWISSFQCLKLRRTCMLFLASSKIKRSRVLTVHCHTPHHGLITKWAEAQRPLPCPTKQTWKHRPTHG